MQRRFYLLITFTLALAYPSQATHIVGGEFELEHLEGYNYELRLINYFDEVTGNQGAKDQILWAHIFQKSNNLRIDSVLMSLDSQAAVKYSNIECADPRLRTSRLLYRENVFLDPEIYNHPEGYYVVWERCCRNGGIENIIAPGAAGQTFYLEFPPVVKNGEQFINSSPELFPPLSDYGCVNQFYFVDFTGVDDDGDSLTYSLADPIAGYSSQGDPAPRPRAAPYPRVNWVSGIGTQNMVPGNPALQISKEGLLTVTPTQEGLFVFSIKCEEFRNGDKIGEVVRDFQMFVFDCPPAGNKPEFFIKEKGEENFYSSNQIISFTEDSPKCIEAYVLDKDNPERISYMIRPVNFVGNRDIFPNQSGVVNGENDTLVMDLCFPECTLSDGDFAIFDLIAMDDQCSQPLMDTVRVTLDQKASYNQKPFFINDDLEVTINESEDYSLVVAARDEESDQMAMRLEAIDFQLEEYGISFDPVKQEDGLLEYEFKFEANCGQYNISDGDQFELQFLVNDFSNCNAGKFDTLNLSLIVNVLNNNPPSVAILPDAIELDVRINESIVFDVVGFDSDNDLVSLTAVGEGFDLEEVGMIFNGSSGFGSTQSRFTWRLNCDRINLEELEQYQVRFLAEDQDECLETNPDEITVNINVQPPTNQEPRTSMGISQLYFDGSSGSYILPVQSGDTITFPVLGEDFDGDNISLDLLNREELEQELAIEFEPVSGNRQILSNFSWIGRCEDLNDDYSPRSIFLKFYTTDDKCFNNQADTAKVELILTDKRGNYELFEPVNFFSPNGDEFNNYFYLDDLPINNCRAEFIDIEIFNRWGSPVFQSNTRDFAWNGGGAPSGIYYYVIKFTNELIYRGTITLVR